LKPGDVVKKKQGMDTADWLAPTMAFPVLFIVLLGVGTSPLLPALRAEDISAEQYLVYGLALAGYFCGLAAVRIFYKRRKASISREFCSGSDFEGRGAIVLLTFIGGGSFFVNFLLTYLRHGFSFQEIEQFRVQFVENSMVLNTIYNLALKLTIILGGIRILIRKKRDRITICSIIFAFFLMLALMVRGNLATMVLYLIFVYHYAMNRIPVRRIVIYGAIIVVLATAIGVVRIRSLENSQLTNLMQAGGINENVLFMVHLMDYFQGGPGALQKIMKIVPEKEPYYFGADTFSPLLNIGLKIGSSDKSDSVQGFQPHFIVMRLLGVEQELGMGLAVGMPTHFYIDGGLLGNFIGFFAIGLLMQWLYFRRFVTSDGRGIVFYSYCAQATLWGLYAHIFNGISDFIIPIILYCIVSKKITLFGKRTYDAI
jgi:oligosaccharide repeat unit polymerase